MGHVPDNKYLRRKLFRENPICPECKRRMVLKFKGRPPNNLATTDHIIPRSRDGSDLEENLRLICRRCNQEKADNMPEVEVEFDLDTREGRLGLACANAATIKEFDVEEFHVIVSCAMCEVMGLDPNALTGRDPDGTDCNWQWLLPAAITGIIMARPTEQPEGDLFSVPDPKGIGYVMRINHEGKLWIKKGMEPGTPLFTIVDGEGRISLAVGPPPASLLAAVNKEPV
tara:strand:- start:4912 stop:5595 length:684 start_codon:yes stop_codon:yes gene_type:complete